jgi:hypothetical protein
MAYSDASDLLIGDVIISGSIDKEQFIQGAADEIDSKIGWLYQTPIKVEGDPSADPPIPALPRHEALLLKGINNKLASGRLIMALDVAGEQTTLHAYGARMVKEAMDELLMIANGDIDLHAPRNEDAAIPVENRIPGVAQEDDESLLLGFVSTVHKGRPWRTEPGKISTEPPIVPYFMRRQAGG